MLEYHEMRLAILSRSEVSTTHVEYCRNQEARHQCEIINPLDCQLIIDGERSAIMLGAQATNTMLSCHGLVPRRSTGCQWC